MYQKLGLVLCLSLIFFGLPAYGEVSLNQEDDFALLANHPESSNLLALKGAGPAGTLDGNSGIPETYKNPPVSQTPPAVTPTTTAEDEVAAFFIVTAIVFAAVGLAYFAVYGVA